MASVATNTGGPEKATRDGYGDALAELGSENPKVVVLDADLSGSTKTSVFKKKFPERFFNVGVAEQNLVGHAAGLSLAGFIPFASSFAMFLSGRAWEIIRNSISYPGLNVKLVASHGGITVGEDGASHQCIEDFAIMRVIPEMTVICPSDYTETVQAVKAIANYNGPVYMRVGRPPLPILKRDGYQFAIGKAEVRRDGKDVLILSNGIMTGIAETASEELAKEGIQASVLNVATIKPLDKDAILSYAKKCKAVVTCEEHNTIGGLGSAVSELLSENYPVPVIKVGIQDKFGTSGTWKELMKEYGLTSDKISEAAKKAITLKQ